MYYLWLGLGFHGSFKLRLLFFLKKTKLLKNGEASVCMRITVDGTRVENNIRKSIDPSLWSQAKESARGKSRKSCDLNAYIENARIKLHQIFCELEEQNQPITARLLLDIFFGQDKEPEAVRTLIGTMQEHNDQCRALVGKDYALITVRCYESCKRYLAELIRQKYGKGDLPMAEVNGELVRAFEFYLKTEKECHQNTVIRSFFPMYLPVQTCTGHTHGRRAAAVTQSLRPGPEYRSAFWISDSKPNQ